MLNAKFYVRAGHIRRWENWILSYMRRTGGSCNWIGYMADHEEWWNNNEDHFVTMMAPKVRAGANKIRNDHYDNEGEGIPLDALDDGFIFGEQSGDENDKEALVILDSPMPQEPEDHAHDHRQPAPDEDDGLSCSFDFSSGTDTDQESDMNLALSEDDSESSGNEQSPSQQITTIDLTINDCDNEDHYHRSHHQRLYIINLEENPIPTFDPDFRESDCEQSA